MARKIGPKAPKRAANLSVDSDLLEAARDLGVNLSAALEEALVNKLSAKRREMWARGNKDAISAYNAFVDEHGVFSEGSRSF